MSGICRIGAKRSKVTAADHLVRLGSRGSHGLHLCLDILDSELLADNLNARLLVRNGNLNYA